MRIKGVVFDLDSTLVETTVNFKKMKTNMIRELEEHGHPQGTLSNTDQTTVIILEEAEKHWENTGKPEEEREAIRQRMEELMNEGELESVKNLEEITGASEAVQRVKEMGYRLAILTRGHHAYAIEALRKTDMLTQFDVILGRGETPRPKPYKEAIQYTAEQLGLAVTEVVMVGDHQIDRDSAVNTGCDFIGVATGRRGLKSWADETPPKVFLDSIADLPSYLESISKD